MSEERKLSSFSNLGKKESTFLRLKRTKFGLDDFRTIKVIGKGAFGEVSFSSSCQTLECNRLKYFNLGQISAEGRYGKNLCYETFEEG